jgi:thioredoxin reductase
LAPTNPLTKPRTIVIAARAQYRKLPLENLVRFEGVGVYHGVTFVKAQLCGGKEVIVVGGGKTQLARTKTGTYASHGPPVWLLLCRST